jgi:hypothetical protein
LIFKKQKQKQKRESHTVIKVTFQNMRDSRANASNTSLH